MYYIHYKPVFTVKSKELVGYDMFVSKRPTDSIQADFDVLSVLPQKADEYERFRHMLSTIAMGEDSAIVDHHPLTVLNYLRGVKEAYRRNTGWENEITDWRVDHKGERV